jgi:hypothetical protein
MINYLNDIITQNIKSITNHAIQWQMVVMVQAQSHIVINNHDQRFPIMHKNSNKLHKK